MMATFKTLSTQTIRLMQSSHYFNCFKCSVAVLGMVFAIGLNQAHGQKDPEDAPEPELDIGPAASVKKVINTDIVIECEGQAYFDNAEQIVVFEKDVVVKHPGFHIECEELEVFLKGNPVEVLGDPKAAAKGDAGAKAAVSTGGAGESVDKIFARGKDRLVALTKFSADRSKDVRAKCGWATYDSKTGDLILHDWPVLNQGNVSVQSTAKDTIIYVRANGDFEASGPAIFQRNKD